MPSVSLSLAGRRVGLYYSDPEVGDVVRAFFGLAQDRGPVQEQLWFLGVDEKDLARPAAELVPGDQTPGPWPTGTSSPSDEYSLWVTDHFRLAYWPSIKCGLCLFPRNVFQQPEGQPGGLRLLYENTYDQTVLPPHSGGVFAAIIAWLEFSGVFRLHGAFVSIENHAALLPGPGGAGKTTAALTVALNGGRIFADDHVFLEAAPDGRVRVWPYPRKLAVTPETVRLLPELGRFIDRSDLYQEKFHFIIEDDPADLLSTSGEAEVLIFPHVLSDDGQEPYAREQPAALAMGALLNGQTMYPPVDPGHRPGQLEVIGNLCAGARTYQAFLGRDVTKNFGLLRSLIVGEAI
jgi:hypothetical protein